MKQAIEKHEPNACQSEIQHTMVPKEVEIIQGVQGASQTANGAKVDKVTGAEHNLDGADDKVDPQIDVHTYYEALAVQMGGEYC